MVVLSGHEQACILGSSARGTQKLAVTGPDGSGASHEQRATHAPQVRQTEDVGPVSDEASVPSLSIATAAGGGVGNSLRRLAQVGALPVGGVLGYQRMLGNQAVQRLLIQRKYLVAPFAEASIDFNGSKYTKLRELIQQYRDTPRGARVTTRQQKLNAVITEVNDVLRGVLPSGALGRNFETLLQETRDEQARINSGGSPTSTPTPSTPTPSPTVPTPTLPTPTPSTPTPSTPTPSPTVPTPTLPTPSTPTPSTPSAIVTTPSPSTLPIQADPRLLAPEHAQLDVEQMVITPGVTYTEVATGSSYTSSSPRAGRRVRTQVITSYQLPAGAGIKPLPFQYNLLQGSAIVNAVSGAKSTATNQWTLKRVDVQIGNPPQVRSNGTWYKVTNAANLVVVSQTTTGSWDLEAGEVRAGGTEVKANGAWYQLVAPGQLVANNVTYDVINLNGKEVRVESKPENVRVGSLGFKQLPREQPLFPRPPSGADVKQLGLGDCYLQALLINIAEQNPAHLSSMMRDNGDGTVSVRFYTVDERTPTAPAYAAEDIRINKSLPETATGEALYQGGAVWARMMQKAFAAFAQLHGQYGKAYEPVKGAGYSQIAGGLTYQLYGVFFGPARVASGFERTSYDASQNEATNLQANADVIKKLLQFSGQDRTLTDAGQIMSLTVGASLEAHVQRAAGVVGRIPETDVPADHLETWQRVKHNLPLVVSNLTTNSGLPRTRQVPILRVAGVAGLVRDANTLAAGLRDWAILNRDNRDVAAVYELMNDIKEAGTDTSEGQRFSYSGHAYSIVRVTFRPRTPDPASLTPTALAAIDMEATQVRLRNPHGTNSPNAYGASQNDTGEFDMTLAQFLRNFSEVEYGLVRATR